MDARHLARTTHWVVAVFVVATVVAFDPWGYAPFGPLKWALVSTCGFGVAALVLSRDRIRLDRASGLAWLVFLAWGGVASAVALDPLYTWIGTPDRHLGLVGWVIFWVMFTAGSMVTSRDGVILLLRAAVVALAGVGLYVALELIDLAPVRATAPTRAGGPFGTAAYLGAACALLVPIAVGSFVDGLDSTRWRRMAAIASGLGIVAALASQTRAGWAGLVVAAAVALPAAARWIRRHRAISIGVAGLLVATVFVSPVAGRVAGAFDIEDGAGRGRIDEWQVGIAVVSDHLVTGAGFEGYRIAFADGVDAEYEQRYGRVFTPDRAHNGVLDVGATTGVLGMLIYAAAVVWLVVRAMRATRHGPAWRVGLAAGVVGYLAQQQFLFPIAEFDGVFWLFAGVLVAATATGRSVELRIPRGLWAIPVGLAAAALAAGIMDVSADHAIAAAVRSERLGEHDAAVAAAEDAVNSRPDSIRYWFVAASVAAGPGDGEGLDLAVRWIDRGLERSPADPLLRAEHASYRLDLAVATRDAAELASAVAEWEMLVEDDPVHARYRLELGLAYAVAGDRAAAEAQWLAAAELAPASPAPATNLAVLYLDAGRIDDAVAMIERIRQIDPATPALEELDARLGEIRGHNG